MPAIRLQFSIIGNSRLSPYTIAIIPATGKSGKHFPPHTDIFHWFYPRSIGNLARLVQIQYHTACKYVTRIIADNNRTPRRMASCMQISLVAILIRHKIRLKHKIHIIDSKLHSCIVNKSSLMDIHIQAIIAFQHQRCLNNQTACRLRLETGS